MLMIADWQGSGLNQREYCIANKVRYHVFHYWYRVHRSKQTTDTRSFLPVKDVSPLRKEQITIIGASGIKVQILLTAIQTSQYNITTRRCQLCVRIMPLIYRWCGHSYSG